MPKKGQRIKTPYPGVFYLEGKRIGGKGTERIYYIVFKRKGKTIEEPAGRQYADRMTPAKAALIRGERIEGKRLSPKETRERRKLKKEKWTIEGLFEEFRVQRPDLKSFGPDINRFNKYLKPHFGKKEPHKLVPLDVDRLRLRMLKDGKSPQTIKLALSLLRRICNFGAEKRLARPLSFKITMPRVHNIKTEDLSAQELAALFKAIEEEPHLQAGQMMEMALFTGMRRGEMFRLRWKNIDFEKGFIHLVDPKGGRDERIPLNDKARELLESVPRTTSPYVFPGRNGEQRRDINHQVARIKKAAGLPADFRPLHGLRHVYASMIASSGKVDIYTLQKLLTHKDPRMTQRYAHLRDSALKRASDIAGQLITEVMNQKEEQDEGSTPPESLLETDNENWKKST